MVGEAMTKRIDDYEAEAQRVALTAYLAALVEGVRLLGPDGVDVDALYEAVSPMASRDIFVQCTEELVRQKTLKFDGTRVYYCGPNPLTRKES
jgi:hypothetical protein